MIPTQPETVLAISSPVAVSRWSRWSALHIATYSTNGRIRNFLVFRSPTRCFDDCHPTYRLVDFPASGGAFAEKRMWPIASIRRIRISTRGVHQPDFALRRAAQPSGEDVHWLRGIGYFPMESIWLIQAPTEGPRTRSWHARPGASSLAPT
jgi:hypothetical protein